MFRILKEGLWIIIPSSLIPTILIILTSWRSWALIFIFTIIMVFFFRDPKRNISLETVGVLAPADGKVFLLEEGLNSVTFFIELHFVNCHLQRAPVNGTVMNITKYKGHNKPFHFFSPKLGHTESKIRATEQNSRNIIEIQTEDSKKMWLTQIVGAFARRLKSFVKVGQVLQKGEKVGLIYFGSMVKFEIEGQYNIQVKKGDKMRAGETIIALPKNL